MTNPLQNKSGRTRPSRLRGNDGKGGSGNAGRLRGITNPLQNMSGRARASRLRGNDGMGSGNDGKQSRAQSLFVIPVKTGIHPIPSFAPGQPDIGARSRFSFEERWSWVVDFLDSRFHGNDGKGGAGRAVCR